MEEKILNEFNDIDFDYEKEKEIERNEYIEKAMKLIKETAFYTEGSDIEDVKGIIRELENEIGEI